MNKKLVCFFLNDLVFNYEVGGSARDIVVTIGDGDADEVTVTVIED